MKHQRLFFLIGFVFPLSTPGVKAQEAGPIIRMLAFSPNGKSLAVAAGSREEPGQLALWDLASRKPRWAHAEPKGVSAVAFMPDGQTLAIAAYDPFAKLLDADTGQQIATLGDHAKPVRTLALSPDGKILATSSFDLTIKLWDLPTLSKRNTLQGHQDFPLWLAFSPDSSHLLTCSNKETKLWDVGTGKEKHAWKSGDFASWSAIFSPDGKWVIVGSFDGSIGFWEFGSGEPRRRMRRLGMNGVRQLALNPTGNTLVACTFSKRIDVYTPHLEGPTDQELKRIRALLVKLDGDDYAVREQASRDLLEIGLVAEPELEHAMKTTASTEVRIRCRRIRQELLATPPVSLHGHDSEVQCVAFSPDGKFLASGDQAGNVILWDVQGRKEVMRLP